MQIPDLYGLLQGLIGVWHLLLFWFLILGAAYTCYTRQYKKLLFLIPLAAIEYYMIQLNLLSDAVVRERRILLLLMTALIITVLTISLTFQMKQWGQSHISNISVKSAIDLLPDAICCYDAEGRIWMKNYRMDWICKESTGELPDDGKAFVERIKEGLLQKDCSAESISGKYYLHLKNGQTFALSEEAIRVQKRNYQMIILSDVTEEYAKTQTLLEGQRMVQELNESLKRYNREIVSVLSSRETLNAKMKIHDELGLGLLQIRKYILEGGTAEEKDLITQSLQNNIQFLLQDIKPVIVNELHLLLKTAEDLGITVNIKGELPENGRCTEVFQKALHECLTNTLRHAGGDEVTAVIEENESDISVCFTNSGVQPTEPVHEKGGLLSLRRLVEAQNGTMEIRIDKGFCLTIMLPKE